MPDKVRTMQAANAVVDSFTFRFDAAGNVVADVSGHTTYLEGGLSPETSHQVVLPPGSLRTQVMALRAGDALSFWKTREGL